MSAKFDADSPGCVVGVVQAGRLVYTYGRGLANLDDATPLTPDSTFYVASVSKQFVAACIGVLELKGELKVSDPVKKWIPELHQAGAEITIDHLLHHTSGLPDYFGLMQDTKLRLGDVHARDDILALVTSQTTLEFQPGSKHRYCNSGYLLLSEIVERVSGRTLAEYARSELFKPLGMTATRFYDNRSLVVPGRVLSYEKNGDAYRVSYLANWEQVGSGGVLSSVHDLAIWVKHQASPTVDTAELMKWLELRGRLNDGTTIDYARGLKHGREFGLDTVGHSGSFMGFRTCVERWPAEELAVIVLSNLAATDAQGICHEVGKVMLEHGE